MIEIDKQKFFILVQTNSSDWALKAWKDNGVSAAVVYKPVNKILRALRRVWIKKHFPFPDIWFNRWQDEVRSAKIVILHISSLTLDLPAYINKINPSCKIIAWYWNAVDERINPTKIQGKAELWSFDPANCEQYHMHFNHQYYFDSLVKQSEINAMDIYFCGSDSGRGKILSELYYSFCELKLNVKMHVVHPKYEGLPKELISKYVSYDQIRTELAKTKAILEIVREGQSGATVREMEALFFNKKLITNNQWIKSEIYYDDSRFFVLGDRDIKELPDFLNNEASCLSRTVIEEYEFKNWLMKFEDCNL